MNTLMPFPLPAEPPRDPAVMHELVAKRATALWQELGRPQGRDLEIWLEAEAEVQAMLEHTLRHPHLPFAI
jgi:hypothetical protein